MEIIDVNVQVKELADFFDDFDKFSNSNLHAVLEKEYDFLEIELFYPLRKFLTIIVENPKKVSDILIPVALAYRDTIYASKDNEYGIWGHDIGDLWIEEVIIKDDNTVDIYIGS
jgi:hypothetical protein